MSPALAHSTTTRGAFRSQGATVLVAIGVACLVALALQWPQARDILLTGRFNDTDDAMRVVMVRDLMAGQAWHDLVQHRVMPPAGLAMHWSRLIDLPIATLITAFSLVVEPVLAERLARIIMPAFVSVIFLPVSSASAFALPVAPPPFRQHFSPAPVWRLPTSSYPAGLITMMSRSSCRCCLPCRPSKQSSEPHERCWLAPSAR